VVKAICAAVLLALAALETGCAYGYVTYFQPELAGARTVEHPDPYLHPPPPAGVELEAGSFSASCTNLRKFVLVPVPWLRRGFRPAELEIEIRFSHGPRVVEIDLGSVGVTLDGERVWPIRIEYEGRRPAPRYAETVALPIGGRARLESPSLLTLTFSAEAADASEFRVEFGEIRVDGVRTLTRPLTFARQGQFVSYKTPKKKGALTDAESASLEF
jgi:hypothetical protein